MSTQFDRSGSYQGEWTDWRGNPTRKKGRVHRLVLLGPPGVGKGTQAQLLGDALGSCHLSTGDLFRSATCQPNPSPALQSALEAMRTGQLVPDPVVIEMVRER